MDIKKYLSDSISNGIEVDPLEIADRFRETFGYLMELQLKEDDIKLIDAFDQFIKVKLIELQALKNELKAILSKCVTEFKVEGKISHQKVTYQSFYYHLKTTAEVLGIKNKDIMNLQSNTQLDKVNKK